jgi:DNA-binding MarR family transcriptional regulator
MPNQNKSKAPMSDVSIEFAIFKAATSLSDHTLAEVHELLSIWGITPLQYYTLRVLHSQDSEKIGLSSKEIDSHLYTRITDVTRLLDRMADKGWVIRERDEMNKRVVRTRLTEIGITLVESAQAPLLELETKQLNHLSNKEKMQLSELLSKALYRPES